MPYGTLTAPRIDPPILGGANPVTTPPRERPRRTSDEFERKRRVGILEATGGTAGVLLSTSVPAAWTRFLNLVDSNANALQIEGLTVGWDGVLTVTGILTVLGTDFILQGAEPALLLFDTTGTVDKRKFELSVDDTVANFTLLSDAGAVIRVLMEFSSSGNVDIPGTLRVEGAGLTVENDFLHAGSDFGVFSTAATTKKSVSDSTGGTPAASLAAISGSGDDAAINNNFATLLDLLIRYGFT